MQPRLPILLPAGLVLAGIIVVWIGLTVIRFLQQAGDWFLFFVFGLGAGLCLAGAILGLVLWLRRILCSRFHLSSRTCRRHLKPGLQSPSGEVFETTTSGAIQVWGLSLPKITWIMMVAILFPILVWLGYGWIPITSAGGSLASLWMGFQAGAWLQVLVKSWPITGAWLQAVCLLPLGGLFLRARSLGKDESSHQVETVLPAGDQPEISPAIDQPELHPWVICFSLLAGVGLWLVAIFMQRITLVIIPPGWLSWFNIISVDPARSFGRVAGMPVNGWVLALIIMLVPLVEEVFFRGFVYHALSSRFNGTWGLVGSSALWAIYSLNPLVMPSLFLVGLGLSLIARQMVYSSGTNLTSRQFIVRFGPVWLVRLVFNILFYLA